MLPAQSLVHSVKKPEVLIVGAGLGGLTLAILLEMANVPYVVYERATEVKSLGSSLFLGPDMAPFFQQIGIFGEFLTRSKPCNSIDTYNEHRKKTSTMDFATAAMMSGYHGYIIPRSAFYDILLKRIPGHRIHRGKNVLSIVQDSKGVMIRCSDGTTANGDVLVGADGANSVVRQSLYKQMQKDGRLASMDSKPLPNTCICLVGQSDPLDPAKYPELNDTFGHFDDILSDDKPYSNNVMCWSVIQYLTKESPKCDDSAKDTEWSSEAAETMCNEVRGFPIPSGNGALTLGDLIDSTPKDQISKAILKERVFNTWYHGRTVLIGDACHKIHPAGGQGALLAMHDAIALANWINVLPSTSIKNTAMIFRAYKNERYPAAREAYDNGHMMARMFTWNFRAKIIRYMAKHMPPWMHNASMRMNVMNRPQVSFLPLAKDTGSIRPQYQPSLFKTLEMIRNTNRTTIIAVNIGDGESLNVSDDDTSLLDLFDFL
ncbi:hypothetical protein BG011_000413 [Mortierella polycephala]|uniref:FAD-binding domain-containing protein n=1 Tax=Mortierella polycephala TaxID=41804 RepID=A0A9P6TVC8_9FUNG|nr:hypothetical protein BG011_000413 [Mortierella polycephala]